MAIDVDEANSTKSPIAIKSAPIEIHFVDLKLYLLASHRLMV